MQVRLLAYLRSEFSAEVHEDFGSSGFSRLGVCFGDSSGCRKYLRQLETEQPDTAWNCLFCQKNLACSLYLYTLEAVEKSSSGRTDFAAHRLDPRRPEVFRGVSRSTKMAPSFASSLASCPHILTVTYMEMPKRCETEGLPLAPA